ARCRRTVTVQQVCCTAARRSDPRALGRRQMPALAGTFDSQTPALVLFGPHRIAERAAHHRPGAALEHQARGAEHRAAEVEFADFLRNRHRLRGGTLLPCSDHGTYRSLACRTAYEATRRHSRVARRSGWPPAEPAKQTTGNLSLDYTPRIVRRRVTRRACPLQWLDKRPCVSLSAARRPQRSRAASVQRT